MPWDYQKAVKGFYSNLCRHFKASCASSVKLDKRHLKAKLVRQNNVNTNRFEISFPSGVKFNSPFDLNKVDFKIINLHLEALSLSCGGVFIFNAFNYPQ